MFNRILVPLDGSKFAERALPHAELFARLFGSTIVLLQVLETVGEINQPQSVDPFTWQIRKNQADQYLRDTANGVMERIDSDASRVESAIRTGRPPEAIIGFARDEAIDLLVLSTHGWGGFTRWNISSVAQKVIEKIYLPVLLIRAYEEQETPEGPIRYRRILMPVDSSPRSECAFSAGVRLIRGEIDQPAKEALVKPAAQSEPILFLTTVIRPPELPIPEPHGEDILRLVAQFMELTRRSVREYLDRIKSQFPVPCEIKIVEHLSVSEALRSLVEEENIDLIIMSAHGHTGQYQYPYGSVAREMLEFGAKPILIIQDIPRHHIRPSDSEKAAQKSKGRA
jgi:nucleotide-binding universal stress UspA family protein